MSLPWVRLDTGFPTNPKVLALIDDGKWRAVVVYVAALAYSGQHGTDGFIPVTALPFLHATRREATTLVDAGLWCPAPGGWAVNGWAEFQLSSEEHQARREKAQKMAAARWTKAAAKRDRGNLKAAD